MVCIKKNDVILIVICLSIKSEYTYWGFVIQFFHWHLPVATATFHEESNQCSDAVDAEFLRKLSIQYEGVGVISSNKICGQSKGGVATTTHGQIQKL